MNIPKAPEDDLFFTEFDRERMANVTVTHVKRPTMPQVLATFNEQMTTGWKRRFLSKLAVVDLWTDVDYNPHPMNEATYFLDDFAKDYELDRRLLAAQMLYAMLNWKFQKFAVSMFLNTVRTLLHDSDVEVRAISIPIMPTLIEMLDKNEDQERAWFFLYRKLDDQDDVIVKIVIATFLFTVCNPKFKDTRAMQTYAPTMMNILTWTCVRWMYDSRRHRFISPNTIEDDYNNKRDRLLSVRRSKWLKKIFNIGSTHNLHFNRDHHHHHSCSFDHDDDSEFRGEGFGDWYCRALRRIDAYVEEPIRASLRDAIVEMQKKLCEGDSEMYGEDMIQLKLDAEGMDADMMKQRKTWWRDAARMGRTFELGIRYAMCAGCNGGGTSEEGWENDFVVFDDDNDGGCRRCLSGLSILDD